VKANVLTQLAATKQVWFDLATVEGVGGVANVLQQISAEQMVFGSHAPFFYFESALLKLRESPLTKGQCEMIKQANARRLTEA
jgi:predicted TIM-barrel fold metal-dependent hydrolase